MKINTYNDFVYSVTDGGTHYKIRDVFNYIKRELLNGSPVCSRVLDLMTDNHEYFDFKVSFTKRLNRLEKLLKNKSLTNDSAINLICSDKSTSDTISSINSNESLAICCGKRTINNVLLNIVKHCKKLIRQYGSREEKTIMILTNKWDEEIFREKYVVTYINYAYKYNIKFVILLVTDFGIIPIPLTALVNRSEYDYFESHGINEIVNDEMIQCNSESEITKDN